MAYGMIVYVVVDQVREAVRDWGGGGEEEGDLHGQPQVHPRTQPEVREPGRELCGRRQPVRWHG